MSIFMLNRFAKNIINTSWSCEEKIQQRKKEKI